MPYGPEFDKLIDSARTQQTGRLFRFNPLLMPGDGTASFASENRVN
jgi:hypothetical protein